MLYGRGTEQDRIDQLLLRAREGESGALVIHGEAGMGKTALLAYAHACVSAAAGPARVLRTVGIESEMELPFGGLHQLLWPVTDRLDRLPETQAAALKAALGLAGEAVSDRFTVGTAVLATLTQAAGGDETLLCLIDDAQWLDQASLDALTFAARRLRSEGVVMLFAVRDGVPGGRITGLPSLRLSGLDAAAVDALLTDRAAGLSPYAREQIVKQAQGNPLALLELPAALTAEQSAGRLNPVTLPAGLSSPAGRIQESFQDHIRRLPEATRAMLLVAAADDTGDLDLVLRASTRFGARLEDLEPAERATLVLLTEHTLSFRHPLIRSATYQDAPLARRLAAHRSLADALEGASGGDRQADRRAWHLSAATTGTDERVADEMVAAARRAGGRQGTSAASAAYERAAQLTTDPARRARLLAAAAFTSAEAGQFARTAALTDRINALALAPETLADFARVRAIVELDRGSPGEATRILLACADRIGDGGDLRALLAEAVQAAYSSGDRHLLAEVAARIPDTPEYVVMRAMTDLSAGEAPRSHDTAGAVPGAALRAGEGAPDVAGALSTAEARNPAGAPAAASVPTVTAGTAAIAVPTTPAADFAERITAGLHAQLLAHHSTAYEIASACVQDCRAQDVVGWLHTALHLLAEAQLALGRYAEAQVAAEEGLAIAEEYGRDHRGTYLRATLATLAALRGDQDRCVALAEAALEHADAHGIALAAAHARRALGLLDLGLGAAESALVHLEGARARLGHPVLSAWLLPDLVEAAVRAGHPDRAAESIGRLTEWATASKHPAVLALLHRCRALTGPFEQPGDVERHFDEALRHHDDSRHEAGGNDEGRPFERARTELLYGEWLRRERRRTDARSHLRAALEALETLDARPWATRTRTELQATGEQFGPDDRADAPLARLSPQEREVVRLAATGATNREIATQLFLSPRTVGHHLYRAFPKLGITSRTELPQLLGQDAEADPSL
ncbi:AAA family ATPase [Streptomyces sp. NPDC093568]|uniref:helix-turn-helix transcriptional regulator n=1 Tax=Streptomyces sp. NPDC093568 TaxID=3366041 RepID=UPI00382A0BEF